MIFKNKVFLKREKIKLGEKLLLAFLPVVGLSLIIMSCRWRFFDREFAFYYQNYEYATKNNDYNRVLIAGDSSAKAAWIPTELSAETYNYALGGATPIEEYFYLKEYLSNHEPPKYLFYTTNPTSLTSSDTLWTRSVYFHRLNIKDLISLYGTTRLLGDQTIFGNVSWTQIISTYSYSILTYRTAFEQGLVSSERLTENKKIYDKVKKNKGQTQFGTKLYCYDAHRIVEYGEFKVNAVNDYYLRKIISECENYNIKFIFQMAPINTATYDGLRNIFVEQYKAYLDSLCKDFPNSVIEKEFEVYSGEFFEDPSHLNINGAKKFTKEMKIKYIDILE